MTYSNIHLKSILCHCACPATAGSPDSRGVAISKIITQQSLKGIIKKTSNLNKLLRNKIASILFN